MEPILTSNTPKLDLHGEIVSMVECLVQEFLRDNLKLKQSLVRIVHGKSTNILTNEVHRILKGNKSVIRYNLNVWNVGETLVYLKVTK